MSENTRKFIEKFREVKKLGFVKSHRKGNTGIGKTFEEYMGVVENNLREPDLFGYEIKTQRSLSGSYVTLFTKSPTNPKKANIFIRDNYGYIEDIIKDYAIKKIHSSIFSKTISFNSLAGYGFSLRVDRFSGKIFLIVYDKENNVINDNIYYSFENIKKCIEKINNLAYIFAESKEINGDEYFLFYRAILYSSFIGFENFLMQIENGNIMYDIRIGTYRNGKYIGRTHDHGSGFRIKKDNLIKLYYSFNEVE